MMGNAHANNSQSTRSSRSYWSLLRIAISARLISTILLVWRILTNWLNLTLTIQVLVIYESYIAETQSFSLNRFLKVASFTHMLLPATVSLNIFEPYILQVSIVKAWIISGEVDCSSRNRRSASACLSIRAVQVSKWNDSRFPRLSPITHWTVGGGPTAIPMSKNLLEESVSWYLRVNRWGACLERETLRKT